MESRNQELTFLFRLGSLTFCVFRFVFSVVWFANHALVLSAMCFVLNQGISRSGSLRARCDCRSGHLCPSASHTVEKATGMDFELASVCAAIRPRLFGCQQARLHSHAGAAPPPLILPLFPLFFVLLDLLLCLYYAFLWSKPIIVLNSEIQTLVFAI